MIKIKIPEKLDKKITPYYELVYEYMIGDADCNTNETVRVSKDNPYLERYYTLLNSLVPTKGTWGIVFSKEILKECFEEGQINEEEYNFLKELMYDSYKDRSDEADEFKKEFYDGVAGTTEYSFLVFEGLDLYYIDEDGTRHEAYVDEEQNTII